MFPTITSWKDDELLSNIWLSDENLRQVEAKDYSILNLN